MQHEPELHIGGLLDAAPVPMCVVNPLDGYRVVDANALWFGELGLPREQVLGRNGPELQLWARPEDRARLLAGLNGASARSTLDAQLRTGSGLRWFRLSARQSLVGQRPWVTAVMQDIQAQRDLEDSLRDSEAVARQIFDVVPETLLISDARSGEFIDVNRAWANKMGYAKEQVVGKTSRDLRLWVDPDAVAGMGRRFAERGQVDGEILDMRRADGSTRTFEVSARQWQASDRHLSIWIARDVTEQRLAQQALQELNTHLEERVQRRTSELAEALAVVKHAQDELVRTERLSSLGALVAGVAHELNTPIGNTLLAASTLEDLSAEFARQRERGLTRSALDRFCATVVELTGILAGNMDRAVQLINGFKQLAVDQSSYMRRSFELGSVVDEVLLTLRPSLRLGAVEVQLDLPETLEMDSFPGPLGQVLINLINNALQHGFEQRDQGVIRISAQPEAEGQLRLVVSDDGAGIRPEILGRVFDPFFTTRMGQGGSGLGLHICFSLVNGLLGGSIEAGPSTSGGAAFTLRLPKEAPRGAAQHEPE